MAFVEVESIQNCGCKSQCERPDTDSKTGSIVLAFIITGQLDSQKQILLLTAPQSMEKRYALE